MTYGNSANEHGWIWHFFNFFLGNGFGAWHIAARCTVCGWGAEYGPPAPNTPPATGDKRWLCARCGSDVSHTVRWVGRTSGGLWEWAPVERLPPDLLPKDAKSAFDSLVAQAVEKALPARLDAEFEARVKAALEVERLKS